MTFVEPCFPHVLMKYKKTTEADGGQLGSGPGGESEACILEIILSALWLREAKYPLSKVEKRRQQPQLNP